MRRKWTGLDQMPADCLLPAGLYNKVFSHPGVFSRLEPLSNHALFPPIHALPFPFAFTSLLFSQTCK